MTWWGVVLIGAGAFVLGAIAGAVVMLLRVDPFKDWL